ncbi:MAG: thioesterase family protein [Caldilineaceae bacterium]
MQDLLAGYPMILDIPVAWGEMDAFQHVNNIVYLRYAESARIAYLEQAGLSESMQGTGIGPILASINCRYLFPVTYPDTVRVGTRVTEIGADRFTVHFRIVSTRHGRVAAQGDSVIVSYDYRTGSKAPLPDAMRAAILAIEPSLAATETGAAK